MSDETKLSYQVRLAVDDDGTPLHNGERLTEVRPGVWVHPLAAAVTEFLERRGR